jgi:predicted DnaQ family exonuclease/DinG family helicase
MNIDIRALCAFLGLSEFVSVDIETTGLDPQENEIIEVAAVRFSDQGQEDFQSFVKPLAAIPATITQLTGISDKDVSEAASIAAVLPLLSEFIGDLPIVGQNIRFDLAFLDINAARLADDDDYLQTRQRHDFHYFPNYFVDTQELARIFNPVLPSYRLGELCRHYEIALPEAHRALHDARATGELLIKLLDDGVAAGADVFHEMQALLAPIEDPFKTMVDGFLEYFAAHPDNAGGDITRFWHFVSTHFNSIGDPEAEDSGANSTSIGLADVFAEDGYLQEKLPDFETRSGQLEMAEKVDTALANDHFLIVEAGTGTGKSLAYLVPAVLHSHRVERENGPIVISTNTKNLQEQLFYKDLPALASAMPQRFSAVLLKGKANYLCLDRMDNNLDASQGRLNHYERKAVLPLLVWARFTQTGDIAENNGFQAERNTGTWNKFIAENNYCPGRRCKLYEQCHLMRVRNLARRVDLVIVNHSLVFADLATDNSVLGEYRSIIFDEAHNIEKTATEYLGTVLNYWQLRRFSHNVYRAERNPSGLVHQLQHNLELAALAQESNAHLIALADEAKMAAGVFLETTEQLFRYMANALAHQNEGQTGYRQNRYRFASNDNLYVKLQEQLPALSQALQPLVQVLDRLGFTLHQEEDRFPRQEQMRLEFIALHSLAVAIGEVLDYFCEIDDKSMINWLEAPRRQDGIDVLFRAAPLRINELLHEHLFAHLRSAVFTSATLRVDNDFSYFENRTGIRLAVARQCDHYHAPAAFDFKQQVKVMIPAFLPDPRSADYATALADFLTTLHLREKRGTLVLFTAYSLLNQVYRDLRMRFEGRENVLLGQGQDGSRSAIMQRFRQHGRAMLLGADSFWEGVDVIGPALEIVCLSKLPFEVPTDPVIAARMEEVERQGKNAFFDYSIPEAVIRFRQGFGRLIRSHSDRGVVLLTDTRLIRMRYGRRFIDALPVQADTYRDLDTLVDDLKHFFTQQ